MANPPISYPPPGMTASLPVDRCCPLLRRIASRDCCTRTHLNTDYYRDLLMGCPEPCERRDAALEIPGARARYERCKSMEHIP